jgi:hypothetical protein
MNLEEVTDRVDALGKGFDIEHIHAEEDQLYIDVLTAIGHGAKNARGLANAALRSQKVVKVRWYA